eukprot:2342260-Pyramimonas_sp.AAC.1
MRDACSRLQDSPPDWIDPLNGARVQLRARRDAPAHVRRKNRMLGRLFQRCGLPQGAAEVADLVQDG